MIILFLYNLSFILYFLYLFILYLIILSLFIMYNYYSMIHLFQKHLTTMEYCIMIVSFSLFLYLYNKIKHPIIPNFCSYAYLSMVFSNNSLLFKNHKKNFTFLLVILYLFILYFFIIPSFIQT